MINNYILIKVIKIHHWNNNIFTIITDKNNNFNFKNGEFVMIGLKTFSGFISRAYSIVSSNFEKTIEFLSIKIPNGLFTSILKNIKINEYLYINKKSTGTLLDSNLKNFGENLWLISTGTGISPFISILKNFNIYNKYKKIIIIHSVNYKKELSYRYYLNFKLSKNILNSCNIIYYPIVTKEKFINSIRITKSIDNEFIFNKYIEKLNPNYDRIMICGNLEMINDLKHIIENKFGFFETKINLIGNYVTEKAFVS